jgi:hypothetical protein
MEVRWRRPLPPGMEARAQRIAGKSRRDMKVINRRTLVVWLRRMRRLEKVTLAAGNTI